MAGMDGMAEGVPRPVPDGDTRPYWEGVARGELLIQRCAACDRYVFYPRSLCPHCGAAGPEWVAAAGDGTIYSYTVVHQAYGPFAEQVPYVVGLVELREGVRLLARIVGGPPDAMRIGAPVRVTFERVADDLTLPYFRLTEGE